jgi:hypothetical protein
MTDRPALTPEEIQRRREADRQAIACNRIEGIEHDPEPDPIFEAWMPIRFSSRAMSAGRSAKISSLRALK